MHIFDQDIALVETGNNAFKATISKNWLINTIPNGGYLIALLSNAMLRQSDKKTTPIITANYIQRCKPGEANVNIECFGQSSQFNRYQACLFQQGNEKIRAWGTFGSNNNDQYIERYECKSPDVAAIQDCLPLPETPAFQVLSHVAIRLDPYSSGWIHGEVHDRSIQKGWLAFREERIYDIPALLLMADVIPPAVFVSLGLVAWVPTIELSINIRNMPHSQWLKFYSRTRFITCGLLETDGEIWDEEERLVLLSRQIAQIRVQR